MCYYEKILLGSKQALNTYFRDQVVQSLKVQKEASSQLDGIILLFWSTEVKKHENIPIRKQKLVIFWASFKNHRH